MTFKLKYDIKIYISAYVLLFAEDVWRHVQTNGIVNELRRGLAFSFHPIAINKLTNRFVVIRIQNRFCKITFHHLIMLFSICVVTIMLCCRCSHSTFHGPLPDVPSDYLDRLYRYETSQRLRFVSLSVHPSTFVIKSLKFISNWCWWLYYTIKSDRSLSLKKMVTLD